MQESADVLAFLPTMLWITTPEASRALALNVLGVTAESGAGGGDICGEGNNSIKLVVP